MGRVLVPKVLLLLPNALRALAARAEGRVPGNVNQEVERVGVRLFSCLDQGGEIDPALDRKSVV